MNLREQILRDEGGCRTSPYMDCCGKRRQECAGHAPGKLTIGVGHNLDAVPFSTALLMADYDEKRNAVMSEVMRELPWSLALGDRRFAVLVNMAYQMGMGGLLGFKRFLGAMEKREWTQAAAEGRASAWFRAQTPDRADRLMRQVESDSWV